VQRGVPEYTAARFTFDARDDSVVDKIFAGYQYVWGFELSRKGVPHYHVVLLGLYDAAIKQRITRQKFTRAKAWSGANFKGDFLKAISYTIKGNDIKVVGTEMEYWVPRCTPWVFAAADAAPSPGGKWLTYRNGMREIKKYREENGLQHKTFREILEHMFEQSPWRPDEYLASRGIPSEWSWEIDHPAGEFATKLTDVLLSRGQCRYRPM